MMGLLINSVNVNAGIEAGSFKLPEYPSFSQTGSHQLEILDAPSPHFCTMLGENTINLGVYSFENFINQSLPMSKPTSDLFIRFNNIPDSGPLYKYLSTIQAGDTTHTSLSEFSLMNQGSIALQSASDYTVRIKGYQPNSKDGIEVYFNQASSIQPEIPFYWPGNTFPRYRFDFEATTAGVTYVNRASGVNSPPSFQYMDASVQDIAYSGHTLTIKTTGNFDILSLGAGGGTFSENLYEIGAYNLSFPEGVKSITIPQLPQEILDYNIPSADGLNFNSTIFYDYSILSGSKDYQKEIIFSESNKQRVDWDGVGKAIYNTPITGGRLASKQKPPKEIEKLKRHLPNLYLLIKP